MTDKLTVCSICYEVSDMLRALKEGCHTYLLIFSITAVNVQLGRVNWSNYAKEIFKFYRLLKNFDTEFVGRNHFPQIVERIAERQDALLRNVVVLGLVEVGRPVHHGEHHEHGGIVGNDLHLIVNG